MDDGSTAMVHRTELILAPEMVTEESLEAARLGRRKQTNRDHSVVPHPLLRPIFILGVRLHTCASKWREGG